MGETVYIDKNTMDSAFGVLFAQDVQVVFTGLEVPEERDEALVAEVSRLCGMNFFLRKQAPEVPFYCVPCLEVFASDGCGGWFAVTADSGDGPVYHIAPDRSVCLVTEYYKGLFELMASDPDWRQKRLPGGPWPRLPEDPEARQKLAETLRLPVPEPEERVIPGPLPRVFVSRAEAEKEFPIQNIWTILRQKKEPRFQVHPMMSPADREGRAFVHHTAWREAYAGLMPENILAAHTLERCRDRAEKSGPDDTFVVLDRENGDRVVGFATISQRAREFVSVPDAGEITALYVLRAYQGLGLGRMLLERCLACLYRPRAALFVLKGNERAIGFYEHMGFRLTGHAVTQDGITELEMALEKNATSARNAL